MRRAVAAAAFGLALIGVALSSYEVDPAARARPLPARELLGLIGAPSVDRSVGRLFFGEYRFLERVPQSATVAVDLRAEPVRFVYPLFGPRHTRRVLPAGPGLPPDGAWVVTAAGRRLDALLRANAGFRLDSQVRGVRVYAPVP